MVGISSPRILVFNSRETTEVRQEILALCNLKVSTVLVSHAGDLEHLMRMSSFNALIWIYDPLVTTELENCIQKSRNFSQSRDMELVLLADSLSSKNLEHFLKIGFQHVYTRSENTDNWLPALKDLLGLERKFIHIKALTQVRAEPIEVRSFCRVGKFDLNPTGNITIETHVLAKPGAMLCIEGEIPKAMGSEKGIYLVKNMHRENLYYRYDHRLELQPLFDLNTEKITHWTSTQKDIWTAPKTKLLWVTPYYNSRRELFFDKTLFSVYTESPDHLHLRNLDRISPRLIIVDELGPQSENTINQWLKLQHTNHPQNETWVIFNGKNGPQNWRSEICFTETGLNIDFVKLLRNFLKSRITESAHTSKFLSRNSSFSRAAVVIESRICEISLRFFSFTCPLSLKIGSIIRMDFVNPKFSQPPWHFGKVISTEPLNEHNSHKVFCSWIPEQDSLEDILPEYKALL